MEATGEFQKNLVRILDDLKHSWFFKLWLAFWLACLIVWFIGLGFLASSSDEEGKEKPLVTWFVDENEIPFPDFRFRFTDMTLVTPLCYYGTAKINVPSVKQPCMANDTKIAGRALDECLYVFPSQANPKIVACKGNSIHDAECNNRLVCELSFNSSTFNLIAYELLNDMELYGPNAGATLWIGPTMNSWVLLTKSEYEGRDEFERVLIPYAPADANNYGIFIVTSSFNSFRIQHSFRKDLYNGWMATSDIGGFIVFLTIFHTFAMIFVGIFFNNDSSFLKAAATEGISNTQRENFRPVNSSTQSYYGSDEIKDGSL